jgi:hypothetical protein
MKASMTSLTLTHVQQRCLMLLDAVRSCKALDSASQVQPVAVLDNGQSIWRVAQLWDSYSITFQWQA